MASNSTFGNTTTPSGTARLGSTLHVKGEITGNEDLLIDGSVEGLVQLEDRKLTVGASAKVSADVIARAAVRWSLGPMTLPHELARVIVLEQLYRATTILRGEPYHRGDR